MLLRAEAVCVCVCVSYQLTLIMKSTIYNNSIDHKGQIIKFLTLN